MAEEIGALRRFRDRYLMSHAPGRALVGLYYNVGPELADSIRDDESARSVVRAVLQPVVDFASWLIEE